MHAGFWMDGERGMEGGGQMSGQRRRATRYIAAFSDGLVLLPHTPPRRRTGCWAQITSGELRHRDCDGVALLTTVKIA